MRRVQRRTLTRAVALVAGTVLAAGIVLPGTAGAATPESGTDTGTVGTPATGVAADGTVRGFVDAHNHPFAEEAFGGKMICGKVFDPAGPAAALRDCPDHEPNGAGAIIENLLSNGSPIGTHDPVGWPTFRDWPAHDSLTHQQDYYVWMERAWRGGLRIMVNDLVANRQLCDIYWIKSNSCDEMDTVRKEAAKTRALQDFVDQQHGGPGKGWFRIVTSPAEARQVIAQGKLAVVMGVEISEPFGCRQLFNIPLCSRSSIDRGLDELHALGVRSMFVCHKFDNALCGVRFDSETQGSIVQVGNLLGSATTWQVETCTGPATDNTVQLSTVPTPHCNKNGLTALGAHMVRGMMQRGMMIELDHMSQKAADQTLDILEAADYAGVISSHSWSDPTYLPRIYALGGFVAQYAHQAEQFVAEWQRTRPLRQQHGIYGYGYGLDSNGFGKQPGPRAGGAVTYPFTSVDGSVTLNKLTFGQRTWDVNVDGVANYGLVPDWIEDVRRVGGQQVADDMLRGAEAYLRTWEGATTR
jgi:microsomal dipeptidase-like Zn-dependent dipeptidase